MALSSHEVLLLAVNSVVAASLVHAGLSKLAVPGPLRQALAELRVPAPLTTVAAVRAYAVAECLAGLALLADPTRAAGGVLVAGVGLAVAALGVLGIIRGSVTPCGCFGNRDSRPLGLTNVAIGLGFAVAGALSLAGGAADLTPEAPVGAPALLGGAGAMLLLCLYVSRGWAWPLIRPRRGTSL
ncbi:MauE/DoxX family redox-associated membrane protein [Dactylosporangium sp. NPDC005572]|uniref:MauE/DoxX family redox-associated membrane protein n=1 Tax=Dactylosporangium sp. NPDC005572 TaxID=3156889 RepID=UPI0033AB79B8